MPGVRIQDEAAGRRRRKWLRRTKSTRTRRGRGREKKEGRAAGIRDSMLEGDNFVTDYGTEQPGLGSASPSSCFPSLGKGKIWTGIIQRKTNPSRKHGRGAKLAVMIYGVY